jgi:hypothetical protein
MNAPPFVNFAMPDPVATKTFPPSSTAMRPEEPKTLLHAMTKGHERHAQSHEFASNA